MHSFRFAVLALLLMLTAAIGHAQTTLMPWTHPDYDIHVQPGSGDHPTWQFDDSGATVTMPLYWSPNNFGNFLAGGTPLELPPVIQQVSKNADPDTIQWDQIEITSNPEDQITTITFTIQSDSAAIVLPNIDQLGSIFNDLSACLTSNTWTPIITKHPALLDFVGLLRRHDYTPRMLYASVVRHPDKHQAENEARNRCVDAYTTTNEAQLRDLADDQTISSCVLGNPFCPPDLLLPALFDPRDEARFRLAVMNPQLSAKLATQILNTWGGYCWHKTGYVANDLVRPLENLLDRHECERLLQPVKDAIRRQPQL